MKFGLYKVDTKILYVLYPYKKLKEMLGKLITQGFEKALHINTSNKVKRVKFFEADLQTLSPTRSVESLLNCYGRLVYQVQFENDLNGTFIGNLYDG